MFNKKCTKLVAAMGITLFAVAAQAAYQDIAVNGDFETGDFTGWTQFPGTGGAAAQTIVAGNPGSAARLLETNPAANLIKQANLLPGAWNGQTVDIQFDLKGSSANGAVFFVEFFNELAGGGSLGPGIIGQIDNAPSDWTTYNFSTIAGDAITAAGGVTLQLNGVCGGVPGCLSDWQIDNVSISADVNAVPVPAAVWLFGSGLLGLVGVARRKKAQAA